MRKTIKLLKKEDMIQQRKVSKFATSLVEFFSYAEVEHFDTFPEAWSVKISDALTTNCCSPRMFTVGVFLLPPTLNVAD